MIRLFCILLFTVLLAGCANATATTVPVGVAPTQITSTSATTQPTQSIPAPTPIQGTQTSPSSFNDIPQGVTQEGYFFLGRADAPVTLTDYSDFM